MDNRLDRDWSLLTDEYWSLLVRDNHSLLFGGSTLINADQCWSTVFISEKVYLRTKFGLGWVGTYSQSTNTILIVDWPT